LGEDADRYIHYVVDGAARMRTLILEMLAYSRLGRGEMKVAPADCNKILERVLSDMDRSIEESGAVVTHNGLPTIIVNNVQIGQVFQNLISNAIKFRGNEPPRIHISARQEGTEWIFAVRDNGIGMEQAFFDRIFIMFQRLHTRAEYPGSGIGLAACKKIIERHGGVIWVESEPGKGSTFYFRLPEGRGGEEA
jgi:light-regulated signal transduction histidine kinase (bacteriophytochrome)